jgi:secretion/DNA translocation related TadE-like protein
MLLVVAVLAAVRGAAVLARHRAESAADLAALAAAGRIGVDARYCPAAAEIAARNGVALAGCRPDIAADGRSGTVLVMVRLRLSLPLVGGRTVEASARAGRLPADPRAPLP